MPNDDNSFLLLLELIKFLGQLVFIIVAFLLGRYSKKG